MQCIVVVRSTHCLSSECLKGTYTCSNGCICSMCEDVLPGTRTLCQTCVTLQHILCWFLRLLLLLCSVFSFGFQAVTPLFTPSIHPSTDDYFLTRVSKIVSSPCATLLFILHSRKTYYLWSIVTLVLVFY